MQATPLFAFRVGEYGGFTDTNIFKNTSLNWKLERGKIFLPEPRRVRND